jgi:hypothetical protein
VIPYLVNMSLSNLSSAQLSRLVELIKEKESLQEKLSDIDRQLEALESRGPISKRGRKPGRPPGSKTIVVKANRKRRGGRIKEKLLEALKAAGKSGITVKELAEKLGVKPGNVFSWFYTTGKKVSGIKKVGEAKYAYIA